MNRSKSKLLLSVTASGVHCSLHVCVRVCVCVCVRVAYRVILVDEYVDAILFQYLTVLYIRVRYTYPL